MASGDVSGIIVAAALLGLVGSLGHCVGMCTGVLLMLTRTASGVGIARLMVHTGRITSYAILGGIASALGATAVGAAHPLQTQPGVHVHAPPDVTLAWVQGTMAILLAIPVSYMALVAIGRLPTPESLVPGLIGRWGRRMRRLALGPKVGISAPLAQYAAGLVWGLLPCGLVMTALLLAAATLSPWLGMVTMLAFGIGTCPALLLAGWMAQQRAPQRWFRPISAGLIGLCALQLTLRGFAAWGWVAHLHIGKVMLW